MDCCKERVLWYALLNPAKAKKSCWQWVVSHWQNIQDNEEWGDNTHAYIADIKKVYKAVGVDAQGNVDNTKLTLYLDDEGKPTVACYSK